MKVHRVHVVGGDVLRHELVIGPLEAFSKPDMLYMFGPDVSEAIGLAPDSPWLSPTTPNHDKVTT